MKVTYEPLDPADTITTVFGRTVEAGESIDISDEGHLAKLKGNPEFKVAGNKAKPGPEDKDAKVLAKVIDGRSKVAREARAKAEEANQDASAKERAAAQARAIAEAQADTDKD